MKLMIPQEITEQDKNELHDIIFGDNCYALKPELQALIDTIKSSYIDNNTPNQQVTDCFTEVFCTQTYSVPDMVKFVREMKIHDIVINVKLYPWFIDIVHAMTPLLTKLNH